MRIIFLAVIDASPADLLQQTSPVVCTLGFRHSTLTDD